MKSVDRDFDAKGIAISFWILACFAAVAGAYPMFLKLWDEVHRQGLSSHTVIQIIELPIFFSFSLFCLLSIQQVCQERVEGKFH